jgi:hypothetical protein
MAGLFVVARRRPEVAGRGRLKPDHGGDHPANDYEDVGEGNEEEDVAHGVRSLQKGSPFLRGASTLNASVAGVKGGRSNSLVARLMPNAGCLIYLGIRFAT